MYELPTPPKPPVVKPRNPAGSFYAPTYTPEECTDLLHDPGSDIDEEIDLMRVHARRVTAMAEDLSLSPRDRLRATQIATALLARISMLSMKNNQLKAEQAKKARFSYTNSLCNAAEKIANRALREKFMDDYSLSNVLSEEEDSSADGDESPSSDFEYKPLYEHSSFTFQNPEKK